MSENITHTLDRSGWGRGEWDNEPEDRIQWQHSGFACLMVRNRMGAWCGYVGVPEQHPSFGKDYNNVDVSVHGGLTYADRCGGSICHVPEAGMPDVVWWLGFDCIHAWDIAPSYETDRHFHNSTYRDKAYVVRQTESLAGQLKEIQCSN